MTARTANSFSTAAKGNPSTISLRTASIYQRAGTIQEIPCKTPGMFSIGKTIPESMMSGRISNMPEMSIAVTWLSAIVEMKSPSASARTR